MKNIKFSFIVPNYNKAPYIKDCLSSIYNQTYKNVEVIVVDDSSSDNSLEEIKKYPVDRILTTNRLQAGGARNEGLKYATGDYVLFLDSDDYLTNDNVLEKLANKIEDEDIIFLNFTKNKYGELIEMIDPEETMESKIENTLFTGCPTKCYRKELIKDILFPEKIRYEDIIFVVETLCKAEKYTNFNESFFTYRLVPNSNVTSPILEDTQLIWFGEIMKIYQLIPKYPKYKKSLLNRIKRENLPLRLEIINKLIETGENTFRDYF